MRALPYLPLLALCFVLDLAVATEGVSMAAGERGWRAAEGSAAIPRIVVLGFDGVDPRVLREYVERGELAAMRALIEAGGLHLLESEIPPESPVAWASILTGVNPGRHGIFDFVVRDPATTGYRPVNGMVDLVPPRFLFGAVPTRPPRVTSRLVHETFVERVAKEGHRALGLRPPLAFPVRSTPGARLLSGLGTPDLAGTNGAYGIYSSGLGLGREYTIFNGHRIHLEGGPTATAFDTYLEGPYDRRRRDADGGYPRLSTPLRFERQLPDGPVTIEVGGERAVVAAGATSPYMTATFRLPTLPPWTFRGRVRFRVQNVEPLEVLAEPVQIDPSAPALPISAPGDYSKDLEQRYGPYPTMGWLELTFPLNDGVLPDEAFLKHLLELMERDHAMLLGEMGRGARCVFHAFTPTDRAAHCFWWLRDPGHPVHDTANAARWKGRDPVLEVYRRMDQVVADVRARLAPGEVLLVVSDHGFQSFRYEMNVNQWLINEGYLVLKAGEESGTRDLTQFFGEAISADSVDWGRTRAYALGLGQIYVNRRGREPQGIVAAGEVAALLEELRTKLLAVRDPRHPEAQVIREVYDLTRLYHGPKAADASELQLGFGPDYRVSWQTALMGELRPAGSAVFADNLFPWSGDHCSTDRSLVPGNLLANVRIPPAPAERPYSVRDVAPTVLRHFGIDASHLDGTPIPLPPRATPAGARREGDGR